jgi:hypothetical protein
MPAAIALSHVPFEDLGMLAPVLAARCSTAWLDGIG